MKLKKLILSLICFFAANAYGAQQDAIDEAYQFLNLAPAPNMNLSILKTQTRELERIFLLNNPNNALAGKQELLQPLSKDSNNPITQKQSKAMRKELSRLRLSNNPDDAKTLEQINKLNGTYKLLAKYISYQVLGIDRRSNLNAVKKAYENLINKLNQQQFADPFKVNIASPAYQRALMKKTNAQKIIDTEAQKGNKKNPEAISTAIQTINDALREMADEEDRQKKLIEERIYQIDNAYEYLQSVLPDPSLAEDSEDDDMPPLEYS
jgi:hypothetical protein